MVSYCSPSTRSRGGQTIQWQDLCVYSGLQGMPTCEHTDRELVLGWFPENRIKIINTGMNIQLSKWYIISLIVKYQCHIISLFKNKVKTMNSKSGISLLLGFKA
jgi:hypothetical protein